MVVVLVVGCDIGIGSSVAASILVVQWAGM